MTDTAPATRTPREELRVQLLLQLPAHGFTDDDDPLGGQDVVVDADYNPEALAAWILSQFDAMSRAAFAAAADGVDALEADQAEMIELATAGATFSAMAEWARFLAEIPPVLRRGLSIKDAHDFAATLEVEHARVLATLSALAGRFPALRALLGDHVGVRAQGLVNAAGVPIE